MTAAALRDKGELPTGKKIGGKADFFLGAADAPIDPPPGWKPDGLRGKITAGAQFVQTQFCMDAGVRAPLCGAAGARRAFLERLAIIIGVVPLRSAKSARWIKEQLFGSIIPDAMIERMDKTSDPIAEGKAMLVDYLAELADMPGVAGAHIMAPNNDDAVPEVITEFRKRSAR